MGASSFIGLLNLVAFLLDPAVIRGYSKYLVFRFHGEETLNQADAALDSRRATVHFSELQ
ncbi:hypothetical protein DSO57_1036881 [Entomophthora muscae]|uniref:Uncharacterized protein n=1 Tax=Entomophthora muscae TaxID=34485 RepID=A0ACC2TL24_9FUNG|nr:hypothetical protein DSO57_1036881 [Entomophthora muscae]